MIYAQWLHSIGGIGDAVMENMLARGFTAEEIYRMNQEELTATGLFEPDQVPLIIEHKKCDPLEEWEKLKSAGIRFLSAEKGEYPKRLRKIRRPPYGLYVIGNIPDEKRFSVAVVGARECTSYGAVISKKIGKELGRSGVTVISGMARGVDGCAHRGALEGGGVTYAVLGCGIDQPYPVSNRDLYETIPERGGGIISEYPPGTPPLPELFPMRNRIISGLSDCVVVAEARRRSGSLITAELATEQGKDVYAVPGPVDSALSCGCHHLIHQGAGIYYSTEEFLHDKSLDFAGYAGNSAVRSLEMSERIVYSAIVLLPKGIEEIQKETGLNSRILLQILLDLQLKGLIAEIGKGRYIRLYAEEAFTEPDDEE